MKRLAFMLLLAACSAAPPPPEPEKPQTAFVGRVPKRDELVCFPCHSHVNFSKGPPFPHDFAPHKSVGHCHVCHQGAHHEGREIDKSICLSCHEGDSAALQEFARVERKSK